MLCCFGKKPKEQREQKSVYLQTRSDQSATVSLAEHVLPGCDRVRYLGEGSIGIVVLVRERSTGAFFAIKIMSKTQLMAENQFSNIITERRVLREAGPHPFVIECHSGFQTQNAVVLVLEYLPGGDMYDLLKNNGSLSEDQARFYVAEILVGLHELHRLKFVFRDLKLENILLDERGHIRLADFGLAGKVDPIRGREQQITDISGTAIYQAPEILSRRGHGRCVDFWALGVLTHVMLTGRPPFSPECSRTELYHRIQTRDPDLSNDRLQHISYEAQDFMKQLLQRDPARRLGSADDSQESIRAHPFLRGIDWDAILQFQVDPPLPPPRRHETEFQTERDDADAEFVEKKIIEKLHGKSVTCNHGPSRLQCGAHRKSNGLDAGEYKHVNVPPWKSGSGRISIGLDFQGISVDACAKTWTGTTNDFGRFISAQGGSL